MYKSLAITFSYNIFFVLSGGGTLNYFGAKGFIEQELEGYGFCVLSFIYTLQGLYRCI